MTDMARLNLQRGVPENKLNEATNYSPESDLDRWVIQHVNIMNQLKEQDRERQQKKALENYIQKLVEEQLEEALEKALDNVLKDFK